MGEQCMRSSEKRKFVSKSFCFHRENVWIGEKAFTMSGLSLEKEPLFGANSVITKDIPPSSTVVYALMKVTKQVK